MKKEHNEIISWLNNNINKAQIKHKKGSKKYYQKMYNLIDQIPSVINKIQTKEKKDDTK